jgi:hypothetical protein
MRTYIVVAILRKERYPLSSQRLAICSLQETVFRYRHIVQQAAVRKISS